MIKEYNRLEREEDHRERFCIAVINSGDHGYTVSKIYPISDTNLTLDEAKMDLPRWREHPDHQPTEDGWNWRMDIARWVENISDITFWEWWHE